MVPVSCYVMSCKQVRSELTMEDLEQRIATQESWTFKECLGLADEFGVKTRMVILTVFCQGKNYVDTSEQDGSSE